MTLRGNTEEPRTWASSLYAPDLKARGGWTQNACLMGFQRGKNGKTIVVSQDSVLVGKLPLDSLLSHLANYVFPPENAPTGKS